jgi:hypothetical protein
VNIDRTETQQDQTNGENGSPSGEHRHLSTT